MRNFKKLRLVASIDAMMALHSSSVSYGIEGLFHVRRDLNFAEVSDDKLLVR